MVAQVDLALEVGQQLVAETDLPQQVVGGLLQGFQNSISAIDLGLQDRRGVFVLGLRLGQVGSNGGIHVATPVFK